MASTRVDGAIFRAQSKGLVARAWEDLEQFWLSLDLRKPERARDALLAFMPVLTDTYGNVAATVAADWYEEQRALAGVRGRASVDLAETVPVEQVQARTRFGASHLFTDDPTGMLPFLEGIASKYVMQPARDTVTKTVVRDPAASGWHRETRGAASCKFCRGLAGRGGVYKRPTAVVAAHDNCGCVAVPSWDANAPEVPVEAYKASQRTSSMTPAQKERHNAAIREWLNREFPDD